MRKTEDNDTLVFTEGVKANKNQVKQAMKLCNSDMATVNTLIRPDGEKKAYVQLLTMMLRMLTTKLGLSKVSPGISLLVQWLRLCTPNAEGLSWIPGQGTRSHMPQLRESTAK